ncbi:MAG: hypothetical protein JNJ58_05485 [Chitinophagaceae bacterium]|nr:hypothetical protein [Chitinophagaceae bacterium]
MKEMKFYSIILILLICNLRIFATSQVPDLMVIGKDTFLMHTNPLEIYLDSIGNRDFPDFKSGGSTDCWRGYQAIWRVENDSMFLEKIQSCHRDEGDVDANLEKMFGDKLINGKVYAYWFTGLIVLPHGRLKNYVHMGYGSTYSKYMLLEINKGQFQQELKFNKRQYESFKTKQFELFKKTSEYKKIVEDLKKEGNGDEKLIDSFLRSFVINYTSRILNE